MDRVLAAAKAIASARRSRAPLKALPKDVAPRDEAEGYQVQYALHDLMQPHVGSLVGYKIGCTSAVMQEYINIPHPCGGGVFEKVVHDSGVRLPAAEFVHVGVECEIAVRLPVCVIHCVESSVGRLLRLGQHLPLSRDLRLASLRWRRPRVKPVASCFQEKTHGAQQFP